MDITKGFGLKFRHQCRRKCGKVKDIFGILPGEERVDDKTEFGKDRHEHRGAEVKKLPLWAFTNEKGNKGNNLTVNIMMKKTLIKIRKTKISGNELLMEGIGKSPGRSYLSFLSIRNITSQEYPILHLLPACKWNRFVSPSSGT